MINKNSFSYVSSYNKLLTVQMLHNYFDDNLFRDVSFSVENETKSILKNYDIIFKPNVNGFSLINKIENRHTSPVFGGEISLKFKFNIVLKTFLNITDIPYRSNLLLNFNNSSDQKNEKLHTNFFVDESNILSTNDEGIYDYINRIMNQDNDYFGSEKATLKKNELNFTVNFNRRLVKFRYNFYSNKPVIDFDKYYITDEQNSFQLKKFEKRLLANGREVFSMLLEDEINASQSYSKKLYLKKEEDFLSSFSMYLPLPKPSNISYEIDKKIFVADTFIKI